MATAGGLGNPARRKKVRMGMHRAIITISLMYTNTHILVIPGLDTCICIGHAQQTRKHRICLCLHGEAQWPGRSYVFTVSEVTYGLFQDLHYPKEAEHPEPLWK